MSYVEDYKIEKNKALYLDKYFLYRAYGHSHGESKTKARNYLKERGLR